MSKRFRVLWHNGIISSLQTAANNAGVGAKIIISRWNNPWNTGLHTFFVENIRENRFYAYNWNPNQDPRRNSLSDYNDGSGFIIGYIVW